MIPPAEPDPVRARNTRVPCWVRGLTALALRYRGPTLIVLGLLTVAGLVLAEGLELRMNWTDLLPSRDPDVALYRDVQERFGEASLVVVLEGDRSAMVSLAEELEPRLRSLESLKTVFARQPRDYLRDHAFLLTEPDDLERMLAMFRDPSLIGTLRGLNDDFEREYTSSEENLRRDEVEVARSLLGLARALEIVRSAAAGEGTPVLVREGADAATLGEAWSLSLDRRMLLIPCIPRASIDELDQILATVEEVEAVLTEVAPRHPGVRADLTGMAKISQDEMNSVGLYTQLLSLVALILIYLLLARTFRGWVVPLLALLPLVMGIIWTMGVMALLFGGMNIITAMMMLVLLGLGIDFSIHIVTRFQEEIRSGHPLEQVLHAAIGGSGAGVITGAMTTAAAFLTLMVGDTRGVFEFGATAGTGILLTVTAVFLVLPSLLVMRHRQQLRKKGPEAMPATGALGEAHYAWIGRIADFGWRHPALVLGSALLVTAAASWGALHTRTEWDFLELEAKGLRSVELQREIPDRFGVSDHAAWSVASSVEESRRFKKEFERLSSVGEVLAVSDFLPPPGRAEAYREDLLTFRSRLSRTGSTTWRPGDARRLADEVERLWDNLDLMSNLAYLAGIDRVVQVIDHVTGVESETGETDPEALLPSLSRRLEDPAVDGWLAPLAQVWEERMRTNLVAMADPVPPSLDDLPETVRHTLLPRDGEGFLVQVVPRDYLFTRPELEAFASDTQGVDARVIGTEQLFLLMMDATLSDGEKASLLAIGVIMVLLMLHFRGPLGLTAMLPLLVGSVSMLGLMFVLGMKYNYINLMATPIILGIGIDDGVHALHRHREGGRRGERSVSRAFGHVGKAILLTSLTTMFGFGSVAFYEMRGMASFGQVLFMGVGTCFLATIFILPPVLRLVEGGGEETAVEAARGVHG
jgi:predicted RND superfamily exporter protein